MGYLVQVMDRLYAILLDVLTVLKFYHNKTCGRCRSKGSTGGGDEFRVKENKVRS